MRANHPVPSAHGQQSAVAPDIMPNVKADHQYPVHSMSLLLSEEYTPRNRLLGRRQQLALTTIRRGITSVIVVDSLSK
ncbi:hypothetical protein ON010_g9917 [Phytophthora cinnamomi]|nr:hypothetical protein ON010_g9917 [Phytophthora cinnamomi]